jgi:hypothetical protein
MYIKVETTMDEELAKKSVSNIHPVLFNNQNKRTPTIKTITLKKDSNV